MPLSVRRRARSRHGRIGPEADALRRAPRVGRHRLPLGKPEFDRRHGVGSASGSSSLLDLALAGTEGRHGLERGQEVRAGLQEGLDEFRPRRLLEQVVADGPVRQIDQAVAEDGVQGVVVLVAVFLQQRDDLLTDDPEEPGGGLDRLARLHEERVPDLEVAGVPADVLADPAIQGLQPGTQRDVGDGSRLQQRGIRHQLDEAEPPPQGGVEQGDAPIRRVHRPDQGDVRGHPERRAAQRQDDRLASLLLLDDRQQFAEDAGDVAPVDLVDDQVERTLGLRLGVPAEPLEEAIPQGEAHPTILRFRAIALDEVLVAVRRVEAAHADHPEGLGAAHHHGLLAIGQLIERLAGRGRTRRDRAPSARPSKSSRSPAARRG